MKKKLQLSELSVRSFITEIDHKRMIIVTGGGTEVTKQTCADVTMGPYCASGMTRCRACPELAMAQKFIP